MVAASRLVAALRLSVCVTAGWCLSRVINLQKFDTRCDCGLVPPRPLGVWCDVFVQSQGCSFRFLSPPRIRGVRASRIIIRVNHKRSDPEKFDKRKQKKEAQKQAKRNQVRGSSGLWKCSKPKLVKAALNSGIADAKTLSIFDLVSRLREKGVTRDHVLNRLPGPEDEDGKRHAKNRKPKDPDDVWDDFWVPPRTRTNEFQKAGGAAGSEASMERALTENWLPEALTSSQAAALLGVGLPASEEDVREARRRLVVQWHPDKNSGDQRSTAAFRLVLEACKLLR